MYLPPKIQSLFDVPGRPVISSCGTPTEKVSEFLDHHPNPLVLTVVIWQHINFALM